MKAIILFFASHCILVCLPYLALATTSIQPRCEYMRLANNQLRIDCENVGIDGRSLVDVLMDDSNRYQNQTFSEVATRVRALFLENIKGDVVIKNNSLAIAPNINSFSFYGETNLTAAVLSYASAEDAHLRPRPENQFRLIISETELKNLPKFALISISNLSLADSTIEASKSVKDQVKYLHLPFSSPGDKLLAAFAEFPKLESAAYG